MKKKIILIIAVCAVTAVVVCLLCFGRGKRADIYLNGELIKSVSLSDDCEFLVESTGGYNKIAVKNGKVGVIEADCPDKVCVNTGMTDNSFLPVICMPHRLEIIIAGS